MTYLSDGAMVSDNIINAAMRDLFDVSPTPIAISTTEFHSKYIRVNPAYLKLVGRSKSEIVDQSISIDIPHSFDAPARLERLHQLETRGFYDLRDVEMIRADGEIFPTLISAQRRRIGGESLDIEIVIDNTERKRLENELLTAARTDAMTKLHNRAFFEQRLASTLNERLDNETITLSYIDLNGFKRINDNHGHAAGDFVLKTVADRIRDWSKTEDFLARIGGDEFAIIGVSKTQGDEMTARHHQLAQAISQPIMINDHLIQIGAAIGIADANQDVDGNILLNKADRLMYQAKSTGNFTEIHIAPSISTRPKSI